MNNSKDLILKAKEFYENKNFFEAKNSLLEVLQNFELDKTLKLNLYVLLFATCPIEVKLVPANEVKVYDFTMIINW